MVKTPKEPKKPKARAAISPKPKVPAQPKSIAKLPSKPKTLDGLAFDAAQLVSQPESPSAAAVVDLAAKHVFASLSARSNVHQKPSVCYMQYSDGSWSIHHIQKNGKYDTGTPYFGPAPAGPICES